MNSIRTYLNDPSYDFLRVDPRLGKRIILLTLGGSHAYGTNVETSDIDLRGVAMNSAQEIFSVRQTFEQVVDPETDTTIYSFLKFIKLLRNANPNMFEILGCRKEEIIYCDEIGQALIDALPLFLSKRVGRAFSGYASMQLARLLNKSAHLQSQGEKRKELEMQEGLGVSEYDKHGYREEVGSDGKTQEIQITGITIEEITTLFYNNDGTITKCFVDDYDQEVRGGNVISEKLLTELN